MASPDFISAELVSGQREPIVSVVVTPAGREKLNELAVANARATSLEDYVGLFRYLDGVRSEQLLMVFDALIEDEVWLNHLTQSEAISIVEAINQHSAP